MWILRTRSVKDAQTDLAVASVVSIPVYDNWYQWKELLKILAVLIKDNRWKDL
jgi:hypothetical protein